MKNGSVRPRGRALGVGLACLLAPLAGVMTSCSGSSSNDSVAAAVPASWSLPVVRVDAETPVAYAAPGVVRSASRVELGSQVVGSVLHLTVAEGDTVQRLTQAQDHLEVVEDRYALGLAVHTEVLDAQTWRLEAEVRQADANFDAVAAALRLHHAAGEL